MSCQSMRLYRYLLSLLYACIYMCVFIHTLFVCLFVFTALMVNKDEQYRVAQKSEHTALCDRVTVDLTLLNFTYLYC